MTVPHSEVFSYQKIRDQYYPALTIFINLSTNLPKTRVLALVDSGATISIFQPEIARRIGLKIQSGRPIDLEGVAGKIKGYVHKLTIQASNKTINCPVVFSNDYHASVNLLGRQGFFEAFQITFNESKKQLSLL